MEDKLSKKQLIGFFKQEFDDRTTLITNALLDIGEKNMGEKAKIILRELHGLKGSSKMVGLTNISEAVHKCEDLYKDISNELVKFDDEILNISLLLIDSIGEDLYKQINEESQPRNYKDIENEIDKLRKTEEKAKQKQKEIKVAKPKSKIETKNVIYEEANISVPIRKINGLIDSFGQILLRDNFLENINRRLKFLKNIMISENIKGKPIKDLRETIKLLSYEVQAGYYFSKELKQDILSLKMIPVKKLTSKFPRMVYDISKELGKKISFDIVGNDAEIEAETFNKLQDPLMHLIRNSIDHGIEPPEERKKKNKPEIGIIHLSFEQTSENTIIKAQDDGRGLSKAKILEKAIQNKFITKKAAEKLPDSDIYKYIFTMGFSTKKKTSEISGRGIGMDVVKKIIVDDLKGKIEIDSQPEQGLTFILSIPLTLSIMNILLFSGINDLFGIPIDYVKGIFHRSKIAVKSMKKRTFIEFQGSIIPLYSFSNIMGEKNKGNENFIIVGEYNFIRFAIAVEDIFEKVSSVIKKLHEPLKDNKIYLGAIILGNGKLTPILNPEYFTVYEESEVVNLVNKAKKTAITYHLLVVDDSMMTRTVEKNMLEELGYKVDEAEDGKKALEKALNGHYDLIFSDIQMPNMDGIELLEAMRQRKKLRHIPFIFVSTLSEDTINLPKDFYQGFVKKRNFTSKNIDSVIKEIL